MEMNYSQMAKRIVDSEWFQKLIIILIVIASIIVGLETSESIINKYGKLLYTIDIIIMLLLLEQF
jgi:voltage-gated sodium channel